MPNYEISTHAAITRFAVPLPQLLSSWSRAHHWPRTTLYHYTGELGVQQLHELRFVSEGALSKRAKDHLVRYLQRRITITGPNVVLRFLAPRNTEDDQTVKVPPLEYIWHQHTNTSSGGGGSGVEQVSREEMGVMLRDWKLTTEAYQPTPEEVEDEKRFQLVDLEEQAEIQRLQSLDRRAW